MQLRTLRTGGGERGNCGYRGPFAPVDIPHADHDLAVHRPGQAGEGPHPERAQGSP